MAWCEVNTRDSEAASSFYAEVFGLDPRPMDNPTMKFTILNQGETPVAGVLQMTQEWGDMPPHWMPYFAVANIDLTCGTYRQSRYSHDPSITGTLHRATSLT